MIVSHDDSIGRRNTKSCLTVKSHVVDVGNVAFDEGVIITPSEVLHEAILKLSDKLLFISPSTVGPGNML